MAKYFSQSQIEKETKDKRDFERQNREIDQLIDPFLVSPVERLGETVPKPIEVGDPKESNKRKQLDERLDREIKLAEEGKPEFQDPAVTAVAESGDLFDQNIGQFTSDTAAAQAAVDTEMGEGLVTADQFQAEFDESGQLLSEQGEVLTARTGEELRQQIEDRNKRRLEKLSETNVNMDRAKRKLTITSENDSFRAVVDRGTILTDKLNKMLESTIAAPQTETDAKVKQILIDNALIDQNGQITRKVGTALGVVTLELVQDMQNKEDKRVTQATDEDGRPLHESVDTSGDVINPDDIRNRIAAMVMDKVISNPNSRGPDASVNYGGGGEALSSDVKSALDNIFLEALNETGAFEEITTPEGDKYTVVSPSYRAYYESTHEILEEFFPDRRVNVSYVPAIAGEGIYNLQRLLGYKTGGISAKNTFDPNTATEEEVKTYLSSMPLTIIQDRFKWASMLVNGMVRRNPETGSMELINSNAVKGFFHTSPYAKVIGLDADRWQAAYNQAKKTMPEFEAINQANLVMRQTAKKLLKTIQDGKDNSNRTFYNKYFHASSVGRYFIRNTILNGQNDKLVRHMVGSAVPIRLNVNKTNDPKFKNWMYIIGKNLLKNTPVATEDMGINAIMKRTESVFRDPMNPEYRRWLDTGSKLRKIINDPGSSIADLQALPPELIDELKSPGEWGYQFQSYIDFANWHDAKYGGAENKTITVFSQTQHDGKQNGIAIMAMQSGNIDLIKLIGAIYNDDENVIPEGDVREKFLNKLSTAIDSIFEGQNGDKVRLVYWKNVFDKIESSTNNKRDLIKLLSKTPLMEVSYGKSNKFHHEAAGNFIRTAVNEKTGEKIVDLESNWNGNRKYSEQDAVKDLNLIIGKTLDFVLDLDHQGVLKQTGFMYSRLGVTPSLQGPLGTNIYMGSYRYVPVRDSQGVSKKVTYMLGDQLMEATVTKPVPSGSNPTKQRALVQKEDEKTGKLKWVLQDKSIYGQEVANQLPVLTVQQIDAAVMARTVQSVGRKRKRAGETPLFVQPVHDAIITDANSVDVYHAEINKKFIEVNRQYHIADSVTKSYNKTYEKVIDKLRREGSQMAEISDESDYRALNDYLLSIYESIPRSEDNFTPKQRTLRIQQDDTNWEVKYALQMMPSGTRNRILQTAIRFGWTANDNKMMLKKDLATLLELIATINNIKGKLENWRDSTNAARQQAFKEIAKIIYQYN